MLWNTYNIYITCILYFNTFLTNWVASGWDWVTLELDRLFFPQSCLLILAWVLVSFISLDNFTSKAVFFCAVDKTVGSFVKIKNAGAPLFTAHFVFFANWRFVAPRHWGSLSVPFIFVTVICGQQSEVLLVIL